MGDSAPLKLGSATKWKMWPLSNLDLLPNGRYGLSKTWICYQMEDMAPLKPQPAEINQVYLVNDEFNLLPGIWPTQEEFCLYSNKSTSRNITQPAQKSRPPTNPILLQKGRSNSNPNGRPGWPSQSMALIFL